MIVAYFPKNLRGLPSFTHPNLHANISTIIMGGLIKGPGWHVLHQKKKNQILFTFNIKQIFYNRLKLKHAQ